MARLKLVSRKCLGERFNRWIFPTLPSLILSTFPHFLFYCTEPTPLILSNLIWLSSSHDTCGFENPSNSYSLSIIIEINNVDKEWKEPHPHRRCLSHISWQSGATGDLSFCSGTRGGKRAGHLVRGYSDAEEISSEGLLGFSRRSLRDQGEISSEVGRGLLGDLRGRLLVLWARVSLPTWSARVCAGVTDAKQSLLVLNPK